ncbi:diguanylate cyclase (GGDEF)-like protein [Desulfobaculum xiamenense]|uniref:Diguanylate cyclase (GGDEF)-like protein n=1 Tax=Desulfobaculum xiamenense TaxID=995050 RepID=A0A846QKL6_9BACT|nr:EAL domain-containing protein [Desulfobaculum xiamenense]NJB67697.1 diguanylate cyclase (GGDEF)-like protein [Desulfobaculum xiamenense]
MDMNAPNETILILHSHGAESSHLGSHLDREGYAVETATLGEDIPRATAATCPDLIILDTNGTDADSIDVCNRLKADRETSAIPVIFVSPANDAAFKAQALECGAVDYITTPFQPLELLARIRMHLTVQNQARLISLYADHLEEMVDQRTRKLSDAEAQLRRDYEFQGALKGLLELSLRTLPLDDTLDMALAQLLSLSVAREGDGAGVFLATPDAGFRLAASRGVTDPSILDCPHRGHAIAPNLPCQRAADILHIVPGMPEDGLKPERIYSQVCVPLMQEDELLGTLNFVTQTPRSLTERDCAFLMATAATLGSIIRHKQAEAQLHFQAYYDTLTGLPNRTRLVEEIDAALAADAQGASRPALCMFDLVRFKIINESMGHSVGDAVLRVAAARLRECADGKCFMARVGGDVFAALVPDANDSTQALAFARVIQRVLSRPFVTAGQDIYLACSTGIALGDGTHTGETLIRDADTALHMAKRKGPGQRAVFSSAMHDSAKNFMRTAAALRRALERDELVVHYQPMVELRTGTIRGAEALVRWNHPTRGLIAPQEFIPIAEDTGIIVPLGRFVLRRACEQFHALKARTTNGKPFTMSVNLAGAQLGRPNFVNEVEQILAETGVPAGSLKLEITETAAMQNPEAAIEMLERLRKLGVTIAIDDFGTGYSSLSQLHRFPIDTLKIDRSFVSRMASGNDNIEIVRTVVTLGHVLGLNIIAEGVEAAEQISMLDDLQCEYGQGYFFSQPVPFEKFGR